ncbi:Protein of unknown function [Gryllus bimaculatus]|nr:Protein of unknown function [Gryllus bimaculatus]
MLFTAKFRAVPKKSHLFNVAQMHLQHESSLRKETNQAATTQLSTAEGNLRILFHLNPNTRQWVNPPPLGIGWRQSVRGCCTTQKKAKSSESFQPKDTRDPRGIATSADVSAHRARRERLVQSDARQFRTGLKMEKYTKKMTTVEQSGSCAQPMRDGFSWCCKLVQCFVKHSSGSSGFNFDANEHRSDDLMNAYIDCHNAQRARALPNCLWTSSCQPFCKKHLESGRGCGNGRRALGSSFFISLRLFQERRLPRPTPSRNNTLAAAVATLRKNRFLSLRTEGLLCYGSCC